jgi:hypothetical protein
VNITYVDALSEEEQEKLHRRPKIVIQAAIEVENPTHQFFLA